MLKYYTIEVNGKDFLDSQGLLKKIIFLAKKEEDKYFSLLELRITDKMIYFNNDEQSNNDLRFSNLEYFNSFVAPMSVSDELVRESNDLEIKLFKSEFEKRCDSLLDQYSGLSRQC